ncbi:hypothetical protein VI06_20185 [Aquitalea magnusonii]|nr:hypothetical protein VI06_20185 [Aquitalea magnusonii]QBJ80050.1 GGDEF domain-containing protein [Aquitalea sp. USM4]
MSAMKANGNRSLIRVVSPFVAIVGALLLLSIISLNVLSTIRAYVGGEGLWSKAQKDAIYYLSRYAGSRSEQDFNAYKSAISIQLGDRQARLALDRSVPDLDAARAGLLQGGNHPGDIDNVITAFRWFRHVSYLSQAIHYWEIGDSYVIEISSIAERLHDGFNHGYISDDELMALSRRIVEINEELKAPARAFSEVLGEGSRFATALLWWVNVLVGLVLLLLTVRQVQVLLRQSARFEAELNAEKERAETTLNSIGDAVITIDLSGKLRYLNAVALHMIGGGEQVLGRYFEDVFSMIDLSGSNLDQLGSSQLRAQCANKQTYPSLRLQGVDGSSHMISLVAAPIHDSRGEIDGLVLVLHDKSIEQQYINHLSWQAAHDALTGLYNRREFEQRVTRALSRLMVTDTSHALLFVDLDQFKLVNDTNGHAAGDELLRQVCRVLQEQLGLSDVLARLGGDEFGVLLEDCRIDVALDKADRLRRAVQQAGFHWEGIPFSISASIGMVFLGEPGATLAESLQAADIACYMAKEKGRNRIQLYSSKDTELAVRSVEMAWVQRLRTAMEEERFSLYFQEIVPLRPDGKKTGRHIEVLLRLRDEANAIILPGAFIPAAERFGLMPDIDRIVVRQTFETLWHMHAHGDHSIAVCAINLSGATLCDDNFLDFIRRQFISYAIPPAMVCFEVTETSAISNLQQATRFISELRQMGCHFSLDDFGAGMSSFAYLKHLQVDYLKIDGSFVKDMVEDSVDRAMVEMINRIGHVTGKKTIAEFVSAPEIMQALQEIGVDYAQGYYIGEPAPFISPPFGKPAVTAYRLPGQE